MEYQNKTKRKQKKLKQEKKAYQMIQQIKYLNSEKKLGLNNYKSRGTYETSDQTKAKFSIIRSKLYDYSGACIHFKGSVTNPNSATSAATNNASQTVIIKICQIIFKISQINNTQVYDAHDIDVVIPEFDLIEYSDIYWKKSGCLW